MRKVSENFIGTCQYCFGEYKVDESARIVLHGYRRPGYGSVEGRCNGTGHLAFEYECEQSKKVLAGIVNAIDRAEKHLAKLKGGKVEKLLRTWRESDYKTGRYEDKSEMIGPDSPHWTTTLALTIHRVEINIRDDRDTARYFEMRIAAWTRLPIVGIDTPATRNMRVLARSYDPTEARDADKRAAAKAARDAKPGKLRVFLYHPYAWVSDDLDYEARMEFFAKRDAKTQGWIKAEKEKVRAAFPGKPRVGEGSQYDLPQPIRRAHPNCEVIAMSIDWEYRDRITELYPDAVRTIDEAKKVTYIVHVA